MMDENLNDNHAVVQGHDSHGSSYVVTRVDAEAVDCRTFFFFRSSRFDRVEL